MHNMLNELSSAEPGEHWLGAVEAPVPSGPPGISARLASDAARARKQQTERRLAWLQERWRDENFFDSVVASGRYLKFCLAIEMACESDDRALLRIEDEARMALRGRVTP